MAAVEQEVITFRKSPDAPPTLDNPTKELQKGSPEMALCLLMKKGLLNKERMQARIQA